MRPKMQVWKLPNTIKGLYANALHGPSCSGLGFALGDRLALCRASYPRELNVAEVISHECTDLDSK